MQIFFEVDGLIIRRVDTEQIIEDSQNYIQCNFTFKGDVWQNKLKTAVFSDGETSVKIILENDSCILPNNLTNSQVLAVGVTTSFMQNELPVTIYTTPIKIGLKDSCMQDDYYGELTPTQYEQIMALIQQIIEGGGGGLGVTVEGTTLKITDTKGKVAVENKELIFL